MNKRESAVALAATIVTMTSCGPSTPEAKLMAQLKRGDPAACASPVTVETIAAIVEPYSGGTSTTTTGGSSWDTSLSTEEVADIRRARPLTLTTPTAERVDKQAQKMTCSGDVEFRSGKEPFQRTVTFDVIADQAKGTPLVRLTGAEELQGKYAVNFNDYAGVVGHKSKADVRGDKAMAAETAKEETAPDMEDEDYATGWETKRAPYPQLPDEDRRRVAWLREHCADPSDGRGMTNYSFGHELDSNVRAVYLKMKREHPEILNAKDLKCFTEANLSWHDYNREQEKERAEESHS